MQTIRGIPFVAPGPLEAIPQKVRDAAKIYWRAHKYRHLALDEEIVSFFDCPLPVDPPLRGARLALGLTQAEVAGRMGCSTRAFGAIELRDVAGNASLQALKTAASAMGCEVVVAILPRGPRRYSDVLWDRLAPRALASPLLWTLAGDRQARYLAYLVGQL